MVFPEGVQVESATRNNINEAIRTTLVTRNEELFFFFWGGHGVIREDFSRRLFYSDATATDKKNLDVNDFLLALRSPYYKKSALRKQILVVDACANFDAKMNWQYSLSSDQFSKGVGEPAQGREQFVFLATRPGQVALNLDSEKTGIFSRELLKRLAESAVWPPDFKGLGEDLIQHFKVLRDQRRADQIPGYCWFRDADGFDNELGGVTDPTATKQLKKLALADRKELTDALLDVPCIFDRQKRERIVRELPRPLANFIERDEDNFGDVFNILDTCLRHTGGFARFFQIVLSFDSGTDECKTLTDVVAKYLPELSSNE